MTSSSTSTNSYRPSGNKAAIQGGNTLQGLLSQFGSEVSQGQGLTPAQMAYDAGQIQSGVAENTASATSGFEDQMARLGNTAGRGAEVEGVSNIQRGGVQGTAQGLSNLQGMNIQQQQQNIKNLMQSLGLALYPQSTGGSGTSTMSPLAALGMII